MVDAAIKHGAQLAYELLGSDYENAMSCWFADGAYIEQGPGYFLCYRLQGETATIEFAAGSMVALKRAARGLIAAHGVRRAKWCREWAGKHADYHEWDIERIAR